MVQSVRTWEKGEGRTTRKVGGMAAGGSEVGNSGEKSSGEGPGSSAQEQFEMLDKEKIMLDHIQGRRYDFIDPMVDLEMGRAEKMMMRYREVLTDDQKTRGVWSVNAGKVRTLRRRTGNERRIIGTRRCQRSTTRRSHIRHLISGNDSGRHLEECTATKTLRDFQRNLTRMSRLDDLTMEKNDGERGERREMVLTSEEHLLNRRERQQME